MFFIVWLGRADIDISNERGARSMYRAGNILARSNSRNRETLRCLFLNRCLTLRWNGHLRLFMRRRFARGHGERIELRWRVDALRTVEQTFHSQDLDALVVFFMLHDFRFLPELNVRSLSQSIEPSALQKSAMNCSVNRFRTFAYSTANCSFRSFALYPMGTIMRR